MKGFLARLAGEPLAQFAAIGLVLFAIDLATREEAVNPRQIVVDEKVHRELARLFEEGRGRLPTGEEMDELVDRWVVNETLFREAQELRLAEGDEMMRERLQQRMRLMMYSGIEVETPPEDELRAWFEERIDRYTQPPTLSFRLIGLDGAEAEARALAERLNGGALEAEAKPREAVALTFGNRARPQLVDLFGAPFIAEIEAGEEGLWRAIDSPRGWQVVRFLGEKPGTRPSFESARKEIVAEWKARAVQREARAALDALLESYPVVRAPYDPALIGDGTEDPTRAAEAPGGGTEAVR